MKEPLSLRGSAVIVTRAAHQAGDLIRAVEARGGRAIALPAIEILPPGSWSACDDALAHLAGYDAVVFTSANGAAWFFRRARERRIPAETLRMKRYCAVGEKTRLAVGAEGMSVSLVPETFTAADLGAAIGAAGLPGKRFLHPRGNLADETLAAALREGGATVDGVVVYSTGAPGAERIDAIRRALAGGEAAFVTFASPSAFRNIAAHLPPGEALRWRVKIAVIGPVTAQAVRDAGLRVDVTAPHATSESLVEAIAEYIHTHRQQT